jgi:hypothetical protein
LRPSNPAAAPASTFAEASACPSVDNSVSPTVVEAEPEASALAPAPAVAATLESVISVPAVASASAPAFVSVVIFTSLILLINNSYTIIIGNIMSEDIFDFGFTAVNEEELEIVQQASLTMQEGVEVQARLEKLYNAVQPLLNNLKKNPEKDYIYWPNRLEKVEAFEDYIFNIVSSD